MLTLEDCFALSELTKDEIEAIAAHEHVPDIIAVELGNYLVHSPEGVAMISRMIVDDIRQAEAHDDRRRVVRLKLVLRHFVEAHRSGPPAAPSPARRQQSA